MAGTVLAGLAGTAAAVPASAGGGAVTVAARVAVVDAAEPTVGVMETRINWLRRTDFIRTKSKPL